MLPSWVLLLAALLGVAAIIAIVGLLATRRGPSSQAGISNVVLTVTPATRPCGSTEPMTATVEAHGWTDDGVSRNFTMNVYADEDWGVDDLLVTYTSGAGSGTVISPDGKSWTAKRSFELHCTDGCHVRGDDGTSDDTGRIDLFPGFILIHGSPHPELGGDETKRVTVRCGESGAGEMAAAAAAVAAGPEEAVGAAAGDAADEVAEEPVRRR